MTDAPAPRRPGGRPAPWSARASPPALGPDAVHVWYLRTDVHDEILHDLHRLLLPDERRRADAFRVEPARRCFIATRAVLRRLLAAYLRTAPHDVRIEGARRGKPALKGRTTLDLRFNVAHSGIHAAFAFALGAEVGIDIETIRPLSALDRLARRILGPAEADALRSRPPGERNRLMFRLWTRKEALVKAAGFGILHTPLSRIDLGDPEARSGWSRVDDPRVDGPRVWSIREIEPPTSDAVAALALEGQPRTLLRFAWLANG